MTPRRYFEFDGLRGLLALWVALAHLLCWCGFGRLEGDGRIGKLWSIFTMADAAAETFIILSGFAIAMLLHREKASYGRYMTRRVFRIYPVYVMCLGLAIWLAPATGTLINILPWHSDFYMDWQRAAQANQDAATSAHQWAHLFLVHGLLPKQVLAGASVTYLMPAWSIALEEQFYLVAPLLVLALRHSWGRVAVLGVAIGGQAVKEMWSNPMNSFLPSWLPYFLVGIGSAHLVLWLNDHEERKGKLGGAIAMALIGGALFLANNPMPFLIWAAVCMVACGIWQEMVPVVGKAISAVLNCKGAQWIGQISYSLYLLHWPLIIMLLGALHRLRPLTTQKETLLFMLGVGMPVILLLSWAMHHAIEAPFMHMGRRFAGRKERGLPITPVPAAL